MPPIERFAQKPLEETYTVREVLGAVCKEKNILYYDGQGDIWNEFYDLSEMHIYGIGESESSSETVVFQINIEKDRDIFTPIRLDPSTSILLGPQAIIDEVKSRLADLETEKPTNQTL